MEELLPLLENSHILVHTSIQDCYAMVVDSILTLEVPFPGDHLFDNADLRPERRFHVYQREKACEYIIKDRLIGDQLIVARDLLENKVFDVSGWYAEQRMRMFELTERTNRPCPIGDAISVVAKKLLIDGITSSYPCTNNGLDPTDRFWVQKAEDKTDQYLIIDVDLEVDTSLPKAWLEDSMFDLVGWYRQHLDQHELFEQRYYEAHRESCLQVKPPSSNDQHTCCVSHELRGCPQTDKPSEQQRTDNLPSKAEEPSLVNDFNSEELFKEKPTDEASLDDLPGLQEISDDEDEEDKDPRAKEELSKKSLKS